MLALLWEEGVRWRWGGEPVTGVRWSWMRQGSSFKYGGGLGDELRVPGFEGNHTDRCDSRFPGMEVCLRSGWLSGELFNLKHFFLVKLLFGTLDVTGPQLAKLPYSSLISSHHSGRGFCLTNSARFSSFSDTPAVLWERFHFLSEPYVNKLTFIS